MGQAYQAPTVGKAFQILELVCRAMHGPSLSELSRELGMGKSTTLGIASALVQTGALVRDPGTKRYGPGPALLRLGQKAWGRIDITAAARPHLEALRDSTGESVFLGVHWGQDVTILDIALSPQDLRISAPVGTSIPLLAGATGKVILGQMDEARALSIVRSRGLVAYTPRSITDEDRYMEELRKVRRIGYATDHGEYLGDVNAVACTVHVHGGTAAAIWVVGFGSSMNEVEIHRIAREVVVAAKAVGSSLLALARVKEPTA